MILMFSNKKNDEWKSGCKLSEEKIIFLFHFANIWVGNKLGLLEKLQICFMREGFHFTRRKCLLSTQHRLVQKEIKKKKKLTRETENLRTVVKR